MVTISNSDQHAAGAYAARAGDRATVWLWGEHDLVTADRLTDFLAEAGADGADLVVDLSEVSFMDASTISAIVAARSELAERARRTTVRSPSALMEQVFGSCGLDELIERSEVPPVERFEPARSALESWVAVKARDHAPSGPARPVQEVARVPREG